MKDSLKSAQNDETQHLMLSAKIYLVIATAKLHCELLPFSRSPEVANSICARACDDLQEDGPFD